AASGAEWIARKLAAEPDSRPVAYASLAHPGYSMAEVIAELLALGIGRAQYRVLTAHYTGQAHICSPATCRDSENRPIGFTADGTQWTSKFPGLNGSRIDMSLLADDFFGAPAPVTNWTEKIMQQLPELKQGATGAHVRTVQFQCG